MPAVTRGIAILRPLSASERPFGVHGIARALGLVPTTWERFAASISLNRRAAGKRIAARTRANRPERIIGTGYCRLPARVPNNRRINVRSV
jgi:hypothetical protein